MIALAARILQDGVDTKDDPVVRYGLFREARDLAIQGSQLRLAILAIDKMDAEYRIDAQTMKLDTFETISRSSAPQAVLAEIVDQSLTLSEKLIESDKYEEASRLLGRCSDAGC